MKLCLRGSRRPLVDRRDVVTASEVVVDGRVLGLKLFMSPIVMMRSGG